MPFGSEFRALSSAFLQPWRRGFHRRLVAKGALHLQLPLVDAIAAGGEQRVKVLAAESEVREFAVGRGQERTGDPAGRIADLNAQPRGNIQPAIAIDVQAVGAAVVGRVGHVQMKITLLVCAKELSF